MRTGRWLALAGVLLVAGACGSDNTVTSSTTAAGGAVSSTPAGDSTTAAPADNTTESETPSTLPADPTAAVKAFLTLAQQQVTDAEAKCIADSGGEPLMTGLNSALANGSLDEPTSRIVVKAFATCEPASYLTATTDTIVQQSGATKEQATCVVKAVDQLFVTDDAVVAQAAGDAATKDWPAPEHDKFTAAVATCVPADLAAKIVDA
jgi:hypothetical protein